MSNTQSNRAALLSGLRTGGPRSTMPHTAAPGASFNIPRIPDQDQGQYAQFAQHPASRAMPMTAAVDGPGFLRQQSAGPFTPGVYPQQAQAQALQMQMIQLEMMRMQALQAQQYQAQLFAAQSQNQRRPNFNPPATAGPAITSFNHSMPVGVPMTAAIDGKFGGMRPPALAPSFVGHFPAEQDATTVISGGTALGSPAPVVSKSETAANWRRGGNNNSVLRKKTSTERNASPPPAATKARPLGLSINSAAAQPIQAVAVDNSESENDDGYSTSSSDSAPTNSPPTTPRSSSSIDLTLKDSVKVGAAKVTRQPHGPPSGADELGPRNFASRLAVRGPIIVVA